MSYTHRERSEDGATILDAVITISIVMVLAVAGFVTYDGQQDRARSSTVETAAEQVYNAARIAITQNYSTTQEALNNIAEDYEGSATDLKVEAIGNPGMRDVYVRVQLDGHDNVFAERGVRREADDVAPGVIPKPDPTPEVTPDPTPSPQPEPEPQPTPSETAPPEDTTDRITGTTRMLYTFSGEPTFWLSGIADNTVLALYDEHDNEIFNVTGQSGLNSIEQELDGLHGLYEMEIDGKVRKIGGTNSNNGNGGGNNGNGNGNSGNTGAPRSITELYLIGNGVEEISYLGPNLRAVPDTLPSTVTQLVGTFAHNDTFNDASVAKWDVSNVENMEKILQVAKNFDQDLSHWDVCNVTNYRPFAPGTPIGRGNSGKTPHFGKC